MTAVRIGLETVAVVLLVLGFVWLANTVPLLLAIVLAAVLFVLVDRTRKAHR